MTFFIQSLPEAHLQYLHVKSDAVPIEVNNLDKALMRAIGGCLISMGVGALTILYGVFKNTKKALIGLVSMITIGEGLNASQMFWINSPYFFFPLAVVVIAWTGEMLWWTGNEREVK